MTDSNTSDSETSRSETSRSETSGSGLLGSIADALSSYDADTTPVNQARPVDVLDALDARDAATPTPVEHHELDVAPLTDPATSPWGSSSSTVVERSLDASASQLANRLLDATATMHIGTGTERFVVIESDGRIERPLGRRLIIGRAGPDIAVDGDPADCSYLIVELAVVSRRHCEVVREGHGVTVRDLGAANGTFVRRGSEVFRVGSEHIELRDGDIVATAGGHRAIAEFRVRNDGLTA